MNDKKEIAQERIVEALNLQEAPKRVNGRATYVCPICGNGSKRNGDGIATTDGIRYKCFACGQGGDVFDWAKAIFNYDDKEAFNYVYGRLGLTDAPTAQPIKPKTIITKEPPKNSTKKADYSTFYDKAAKELWRDAGGGLAYLRGRGLTDDVIQKYRLGYSASWTHPDRPNTPVSRRVIIPNGKSNYIARSIDLDTAAAYKVMKAGNNALYLAETLRGSEPVIIVEGEIDALSIITAGGLACALGSTANHRLLLDKAQAGEIKAPLVIALDNDVAGEKAAEIIVKGLQNSGVKFVKINLYGEEKDANDALIKDRKALAAEIEKAARELNQEEPSRESMQDYLIEQFEADIKEFKESGNVKTGYKNLDEKIGGLYPGLYVIGASSSLGKTTYALQMADYLAEHGESVLYFTLEQSKMELASKSIARIARQESARSTATSLQIRKGEAFPSSAFRRYYGIAKNITVIECAFNYDIEHIKADIERQIKATGKKPIVFIDYLQIIPPTDPRQNDKEKLDAVVRVLKKLQMENSLIVIAISSINRSNYLAPIEYESFKESGGIEYTADVLIGLQYQILTSKEFKKADEADKREQLNKAKNQEARKISLVCLKNRYGESGFTCNYSYFCANDLFISNANADDLEEVEEQIVF